MEEKICSFTGHRDIKREHMSFLPELLDRSIEYAYKEGCRAFLTGGAIGFDTLAARQVVKFRMFHRDVRLILVLPCMNQDAKWSDAQRNSYQFLLKEADEVIYVSEEYDSRCMARRNRYLATRADILIAYLSKSISGAAQTVRMAEQMQKQIFNLYGTLERRSQNGE